MSAPIPGPWYYHSGQVYADLYPHCDRPIAARPLNRTATSGYVFDPVTVDATMRLIAAVPELRRALERIRNACPPTDKAGRVDADYVYGLQRIARLALAAAGEGS
jgi:hypothetical protein